MPSKKYQNIAREKLQTEGPRLKGKNISKMRQEAELSTVSRNKSNVGYAIFIICCISAGILVAVVINENQEEEIAPAPFIDDENQPAPYGNDDSTYQEPIEEPTTGIQSGDQVEMAYKLWVDWDEDGSVDTNEEPYQDSSFTTEVSSSKLIYGFYKNVLGMQEGQEKTFTVPPEEAYSSGELDGKTLVFYVKILDIK